MSLLHPNGIFGHIFKVDDQDYYYDVNTNQILEVDCELAAVIELYGTVGRKEISQKLGNLFPEEKIHEACGIIEVAQKEEKLFLTKRPILEPPSGKMSEQGKCDANLKHLVLTVTEQCNMRCKYCLHGAKLDWVRGHSGSAMSLATALKSQQYFLDRVEEGTTPVISFYGGEALLELGTIEKVIEEGRKHPKGQDAMYVIDTNGLLLSDKAIDLVVREKVHLQVSIDGPELWHDRNRVDARGKGTLVRILGNLDRLLGRDPTAANRLALAATLTPPIDLFELADFFAEFPPFINNNIKSPLSLRINYADLRGLDWLATEQDFLAYERQLNQARELYLKAIANGTRDDLSPMLRALFEPSLIKLHCRSRGLLGCRYNPGGNCLPGKRKLHVTVDGQFQPCERTGRTMELGNLENGIESAKVLNLQERFHESVRDKCGNCWALRLCGICYAVQAADGAGGGTGVGIREAECRKVRLDRENSLKMLGGILGMEEERKRFLEGWVVV